MRSRKLLALLFCLITFPAIAGYMTLLGAGVGSIAPVVSWVSGTDAFPSTLSFSRTSNATMFDSTGKLTYAPNNLLLNTETLSTQSVNLAANTNYILTYYGTGSVALSGTASGTPSGTNPSYVKFASSGAGSATFTVTGSVTNASLAAVTYETSPRTADQVITTSSAYYGPRIDYDPNTLAVKGLLIEAARTNLALQSNTLSNASWSRNLVGAPAQNVTGIDGTTSAWTITASGTTDTFLYQTGSFVGPYAYSAVFKAGTDSWAYIAANGGGNKRAYVFFDLTNGVVGLTTYRPDGAYAGTLTGYGIINLGNGFYRCWMAVTGTTDTYVAFGLADGNANVSTTNGRTVIMGELQAEAGAFPTSIVRTTSASVTRAADVVQFTGAALTALQGSAATFIGQTIGLPFNPAANSALVAATAGNAVIAYVTNSNAVGVAAAATYNGAVALTVGTPNYTTAMRIGSAFSGSGRSLVVNGGSVATDANAIGSRPAVYLGGTGASLYLNGWMQSFAIYNQRLPDATLQSKSVVNAAY